MKRMWRKVCKDSRNVMNYAINQFNSSERRYSKSQALAHYTRWFVRHIYYFSFFRHILFFFPFFPAWHLYSVIIFPQIRINVIIEGYIVFMAASVVISICAGLMRLYYHSIIVGNACVLALSFFILLWTLKLMSTLTLKKRAWAIITASLAVLYTC